MCVELQRSAAVKRWRAQHPCHNTFYAFPLASRVLQDDALLKQRGNCAYVCVRRELGWWGVRWARGRSRTESKGCRHTCRCEGGWGGQDRATERERARAQTQTNLKRDRRW